MLGVATSPARVAVSERDVDARGADAAIARQRNSERSSVDEVEGAAVIVITVRPGKLSKDGAATGAKVPELAHGEHAGRLWEVSSVSGAACALARLLCATGVADGPWETRGEDGQRRLYGPSLHRLAKLTVTDGGDGIRFRKWEPYSGEQVTEAPLPPIEVGWSVPAPA